MDRRKFVTAVGAAVGTSLIAREAAAMEIVAFAGHIDIDAGAGGDLRQDGPLLEYAAGPAAEQCAAFESLARCVLCLQVDQMALIKS